jgi:hypothetical protein
MFVTLHNFISTVSNVLFDTFYICAWFCFLSREFYKIYVYPLNQDIETLKFQQDILYKAIKKLKNIIDIDNSSSAQQLKSKFNHIKSDLDSMYRTFGKRLDKIEDELSSKSYPYKNKCESDYEEEDEEEDEQEDDEQEDDEQEEDEQEEDEQEEEDQSENTSSVSSSDNSSCILPIQNHITFPHFIIFGSNNSNKKCEKTLPKLLSHQLCRFLNCELGTTMHEKDIYANVLKQIKGNKNITRLHKIKIVPAIQKLFGISENEDYEITFENLPKFIKPHIK